MEIEAKCPLCGKPIIVKDGLAFCDHYPTGAKILISSDSIRIDEGVRT